MQKKTVLALAAAFLGSACGASSGLDEARPDVGRQGLLTGPTVRYDFETAGDTAGWAITGGCSSNTCSVSQVTSAAPAPVFTGGGALMLHIVGGPANQVQITRTQALADAPPAGNFIQFHIWFPSGHPVAGFNAYAKGIAQPPYPYYGGYTPKEVSAAGDTWFNVNVLYPSNATGFSEVGFDLDLSSNWDGYVYIDTVAW